MTSHFTTGHYVGHYVDDNRDTLITNLISHQLDAGIELLVTTRHQHVLLWSA